MQIEKVCLGRLARAPSHVGLKAIADFTRQGYEATTEHSRFAMVKEHEQNPIQFGNWVLARATNRNVMLRSPATAARDTFDLNSLKQFRTELIDTQKALDCLAVPASILELESPLVRNLSEIHPFAA